MALGFLPLTFVASSVWVSHGARAFHIVFSPGAVILSAVLKSLLAHAVPHVLFEEAIENFSCDRTFVNTLAMPDQVVKQPAFISAPIRVSQISNTEYFVWVLISIIINGRFFFRP